MKNSRALAATIVAVLASSGCGGVAEESSAASMSASTSESPNRATLADDIPELLRFTAPLVGGGTFDGASLADQPVAFWFWAPT